MANNSAPVADTALNGAQITSLLLVTDAVSSKRYPADAGEGIIRAAFPTMPTALIHQFVAQLATYSAPVAPAADPIATDPGSQP